MNSFTTLTISLKNANGEALVIFHDNTPSLHITLPYNGKTWILDVETSKLITEYWRNNKLKRECHETEMD